jgi:hypothetical protein
MEDKRTLSTVLLVAGIAILLISLFADPMGLGASPVFGYRQIVGAVAGAVVAVAGLVLLLRE